MITKEKSAGQCRRWWFSLLAIILFAILPVACSAPFQSPAGGASAAIDLGSLVSNIGSRELGGIQSARLLIKDSGDTVVFDQTYTEPPPNNQVMVDLRVNQSYTLTLTFYCYVLNTAQTAPMTYINRFVMPASGGTQLTVTVPSGQTFDKFMGEVMPMVGNIMGWSLGDTDPENAMALAMTAATNGSPASGVTPSGKIGWEWTKDGSNITATVTCLSDQVLGTTGYTLLGGSFFQFANTATPGMQEVLSFKGGPIEKLSYTYDGTKDGQAAGMIVNDFDYLPYYQAVVTATPPLILHVATTGNDASGDGSSGNPYASIPRAMAAVNTATVVKPGSEIRVASGTYALPDNFYLPPGISLKGSYVAGTWTRNIAGSPSTTVTVGPDASGRAMGVSFSDTTVPAEVSGLSINISGNVAKPMFYGVIINRAPNIAVRDNAITISCNASSGASGDSAEAFGIMVNGTYNGRIERNKISVTTINSNATAMAGAQALNFGSDQNAATTTSAPEVFNNVLSASATGTSGGSAVGIDWYASGIPYAPMNTTFYFNPVIRNNTIRVTGVSSTNGICIGSLGSPGVTIATSLRIDNNIMYCATNTMAGKHGILDSSASNSIDFASFMSNVYLTYNSFGDFIMIANPARNYNSPALITAGLGVTANGTINENTMISSLFVSEGSNFNLTAAARALSGTIGAGQNGILAAPAWTFTDDFLGTARPNSGVWMVGAYQ